jgi:acyl carrier protein
VKPPPESRAVRAPEEGLRGDVFDTVVAFLRREVEVEGEIGLDTSFTRDLDVDSLDLHTLAQRLEDRFGVRIAEDEAVQLQRVGQLVDFVAGKLGGGAR